MNHLIHTTDEIMRLVGMQVFDLLLLTDFSDTHQKGSQFTQYITTDPSGGFVEPEELYSGILQGNAEILRWDEDDREYSNKELTSYAFVDSGVYTPLEWATMSNDLRLREKYRHENDSEDYYAGLSFNNDQAKELVEDVINSSSGNLVWHPELFYVINDTVRRFTPRMSAMLFDSSKMTDEKEIATYTPFIADVPRTKGGFEYGATETENREEKDGLASYRPAIEGDRTNPDNLRAGELELSFNEVTGKYESGTKQVLVRLTTDISDQ